MPFAVAAGVAGVAGIAGAVISSQAQKSAANTQAASQQQAANLQAAQQAQTRADLAPYNQAGQNNLDAYGNWYKVTADQAGQAFNLAQDHIPQAMTEANLIQTPGYKFNLSQGMRAVSNSNAAKGLGVSGAALQGAAGYATGLADQTYQQQFSNQQSIYNDYSNQANTKLNQLNAIYAQIAAPVTTGENAAAQTGDLGYKSAAAIGNNLTQAGNAQAAGQIGSATTISNGLTNASNAGMQYLGIQQALNNGTLSNPFGGGGSGPIDDGTF